MQGRDGREKAVLTCARNLFANEGVLRLWAGTGSRVTGLIFSAGSHSVCTCYIAGEQMNERDVYFF